MKRPAPRLPNGKPSMSGIWSTTRRADITRRLANQPTGHVPELPYTDSTPGSFIEDKRTSLVWHYRKADPEFGAWKAALLAGD
jgi:hypothetical protein